MANNLENLRRAHNAFSDGNLEEAARLVSNNINFTDHGRGLKITSREGFIEWMNGFRVTSSDIRLVDATYIETGNTVIAQFRAIGTQDGPLGDFPATNNPFSLDVCEIWHYNDNGEAIEGHNYSDGLGMLMQLGLMAAPAQS